jgi:hypothetical protein
MSINPATEASSNPVFIEVPKPVSSMTPARSRQVRLVYLGSYLYFIFIFSTIGQGIMQTIWGKVEELSKVMR